MLRTWMMVAALWLLSGGCGLWLRQAPDDDDIGTDGTDTAVGCPPAVFGEAELGGACFQ